LPTSDVSRIASDRYVPCRVAHPPSVICIHRTKEARNYVQQASRYDLKSNWLGVDIGCRNSRWLFLQVRLASKMLSDPDVMQGFRLGFFGHPIPVFLRGTGCRVAIGGVKSYSPVFHVCKLGNTPLSCLAILMSSTISIVADRIVLPKGETSQLCSASFKKGL
jgi:hypothetical protein